MIHVLIIVIMLMSNSVQAFLYDSALLDAQKENWNIAHEKFATLITDNSDNGDVLYDAGVVAHSLGKFLEASAYFVRAAECGISCDLQVRSYFNAGNACVALRELEKALELYDEALKLEPDNIFVKHNRDIVAEMLKQKQEQEQQKQDQKDQDEKQENQDDQKQDEQNQDSKNKENKNQNGDGGDDGEQQSQSDSQKGEDSVGDQSGKQKQDATDDDSNGSQEKDMSKQDKRDPKSNGNHQGDGNDNSHDKSDDKQQKSGGDERDKHNDAPGKDTRDSTVASPENKEQDEQARGAHEEGAEKQAEGALAQALEDKVGDALLTRILQQQEARDKVTNQRLISAKIGQSGGTDGQNCW